MKNGSKSNVSKKTVFGAESFRLACDKVEVFVTEQGGHMAPVTFDRKGRRIRPLSIAPWAEEDHPSEPPLIRNLRGDFFCLPFGAGSKPYGKEKHPPHGETANRRWRLMGVSDTDGMHVLHMRMNTRTRKGRIDKFIELRDGQDAVYQRHVISNMSGKMCPGHHAMILFPDRPGSGIVTTSPFRFGQVHPTGFEDPGRGGYSSLKTGAVFKELDRVPMKDGGITDLSSYPARRGFEDLVMLVGDSKLPFAWTAVTFPRERYAWFSLKDPDVLKNTVMWISNGGRHFPPWNGRHRNVMGLEEVTACFDFGLADSARPNSISARGFETCIKLNSSVPTVVNYIMGVAKLPAGFDKVARIERNEDGKISLVSAGGRQAKARVDLSFLEGRHE